ncbi:MAG TPA: hypothetical protein VMY59_01020 [Candidatus Thermoplasmatota archaeon]|nr:hypothetical protein [Candidatus Thermoplasmatota archaeon]
MNHYNYVDVHSLPKDLQGHIDAVKKLGLDGVVKSQKRIYGHTVLISNMSSHYFIHPLVEYGFSQDFFSHGSTVLSNGKMVSFVLRLHGKYFANNVFLVVE